MLLLAIVTLYLYGIMTIKGHWQLAPIRGKLPRYFTNYNTRDGHSKIIYYNIRKLLRSSSSALSGE